MHMAKRRISQQTQNINQQLKQKTSRINEEKDTFLFSESLTISELAKRLNHTIPEIIQYFMKKGQLLNQNKVLDKNSISEICEHWGINFEETKIITYENLLENIELDNDPKKLVERPPVVTIMGHVDHGKTTLLDTIRKSKITHKEHGGITQHIGAYQVKTETNKLITFIDTPGHEAFTEMRSRGSKITDIVILVVAADDGVMPQTREAIDHAKVADVSIIVFVNKMDKLGANTERIMNELSNCGLTSEEWGGDTIFVYGSALKHQGIDDLLEAILVVAELKELKANPNRTANGTVIETHHDKNVGSICTLLVQGGTLKVSDIVVAGSVKGKIKRLINDLGKEVIKAGPSMPVQVLGFETAPSPGESFIVFNDDKTARRVSLARQTQEINKSRNNRQITLGNLVQDTSDGQLKQINVILRADTQGSVQAIVQAVQKINVNDITVKFIRATVGGISESDIKLAQTSNSIVYGFNVRPNNIVREAAVNAGVEIRLHNIIYKVTEELQQAAKGLLEPTFEDKVLGQARVIQTFHFSKVGTIAGCVVIDGLIKRNSKVHIIRDDIVIYTGDISTLKHEKNDLKEAKKETQCGITIKNYNDLKENDIIESFLIEEVLVK